MTIDLTDNAPRVSYSVSTSTTEFAVPFEFFDDADLTVVVAGTTKTLTTHYTVSGGDGATGTVTMTSGNAVSSGTVIIFRDIAFKRSSDFPTSGAFPIATLNTELDRNIALFDDQQDRIDRSIRLLDTDDAATMTVPVKASRLGKILGFHVTTGAVETVGDSNTITTIQNAIGDNTLTLTGAITGGSFVTSGSVTGGSLVADNITIDGTEIDLSSGDLTIDVAGDISLDADGGDVFVKDAGSTYGSLTNNSGNLIIKSGTTTSATFTGANVAFAGNVTVDGNLDVTGSFDMSDANITNIGSIALDTITSDGNTITLDATTDIVLDAGGADVTLKDDGTTFGSLTNNSGELQIKSGSTPTAAVEFSGANTTLKGNLTVDGNLSMGTDSITNVTTIAANSYLNNSGDLTLDSSANIVLDADSSHVFLKNNGTEFGALVDSSGQLHIRSGSDGTSSSNTAIELSNGNVTFPNTVTVGATKHLRFGDSGTYIHQSADGVLDLVSDTEIEINATTIDMNGAADISGNVSIGGNVSVGGDLDVTGSFDMSDANITNIGSIALDTITNDGSDITLDSSGTIILDADGSGQVEFKDGGVSYGSVNSSGGTGMNLVVSQADNNFEIWGTDGGASIKAVEVSMADDGATTFKSSVTATSFVGALTGNVTGDVSGNAGTVTVSANQTNNETVYLTFVDGATGSQGLETDTALSYNPSTNILTTNSLQAGNIAMSVSTLSLSTDFTIDVTGNISLDADDGGQVRFKDGGAEYLSIYEDASNNAIIQTSIADTNILFKGTDGSSVITALDLDMENAGAATFNSTINGVGISYNITNFSESMLISNDAGTGTLDNAAANTGFGHDVFNVLTSGDNNTAMGHESGDALTSGSLNTFIGSNAGGANQSSDSNTAIGAFAFDAGTGANNTAVGSGALGGASNSGGENVAVGNDAGNAISSGQRNVIVGTLAGDALTTGQGNIAIGYDALGTEDTGSFNTAVGREALKVLNYDGNGFNVALGYYAGLSLTTGLKNTLLGTYAGDNITTEDFNTLIGYACGDALTTGKLNTAVGAHSLDADTKGWASTAVGYFALGAQTFTSSTVSENQSDNTAMGYFAGSLTTTGKKNTYFGSLAGDDCIDGSFNTAIGYQTLSADHGDYNTAVGMNAGKVVTGVGNTIVGAEAGNALTDGDSNILMGYASAFSGTSMDAEFVIGAGVTGSGGSTITIGSGAGKISNTFTSNATWSQSSDERLKTDIKSDSLGLSFINRLNPVTFKWKPSNEIDKSLPYYKETNEKDTSTTMHGLVAQEVKTALDAESCTTFAGWGEGLDGVQTISREMFVSPLIKAIQELSAKVTSLEAEVTKLKGA